MDADRGNRPSGGDDDIRCCFNWDSGAGSPPERWMQPPPTMITITRGILRIHQLILTTQSLPAPPGRSFMTVDRVPNGPVALPITKWLHPNTSTACIDSNCCAEEAGERRLLPLSTDSPSHHSRA